MKEGEIVYSKKYTFPDGSISDKFIINLNDPQPNEPYLILLVTSKQYFRETKPGCHSSVGYYVIPEKVDYFDRDITWVLFNTLKEFTLEEELRESWNYNFVTKAHLKPATLRAIINCLKQSDWITKYQASLLN